MGWLPRDSRVSRVRLLFRSTSVNDSSILKTRRIVLSVGLTVKAGWAVMLVLIEEDDGYVFGVCKDGASSIVC